MTRTCVLRFFFTAILVQLVLQSGASAQEFRGLKTKIKAVLDEQGVPGASVAIVVKDRIVWAEGIGTAEAGSKRPVTAMTLFQAASISKPVAAIGALRLVEDGKLDLDKPIAGFLKSVEIEGTKSVSLRQLLSHTSGLAVHGFAGYEGGTPFPDLKQVLLGSPPANSSAIQPATEAGKFKYSGGGYCVVQQLVQDVSGTAFPEAMNALVLQPLRMKDSTYAQPLTGEPLERAAAGHNASSGIIGGKRNVYPEMAAAGLWTTASDLARFAIAVQQSYAGEKDSFLQQPTATQMLTAQVEGGPGLGLFVTGDTTSGAFEHGGVNNGFKANLVATKRPGSVLVIMTNSDNGNKVYGAIQDLIRKSR